MTIVLAVRPAYRRYRAAILRTTVRRKSLQRRERVGDLHDAAVRRQVAVAFDHECPHPAVVHRADVLVRVVIDTVYGDEHRAVAAA